MNLSRRAAALAVALLLPFGAVACGDDPGEDEIGDGEINDSEGD